MSKFNVGDRVKVVDAVGNGIYYKNGDMGVIKKIATNRGFYGFTMNFIDFDNGLRTDLFPICDDEIEPIIRWPLKEVTGDDR